MCPHPYIDQRCTKEGWWVPPSALRRHQPVDDLGPSPDFAMCYPLIIALNVAGAFKNDTHDNYSIASNPFDDQSIIGNGPKKNKKRDRYGKEKKNTITRSALRSKCVFG